MPQLLNIDDSAIKDCLETGMTITQTAEVLGCSRSTISRRISQLNIDKGLLSEYRELQHLQLTQLQAQILEAITPEKIEQAELRDLVSAFRVLKEKEQEVSSSTQSMKGLVSYLVHIEKELQERPGVDSPDGIPNSSTPQNTKVSLDISWEE